MSNRRDPVLSENDLENLSLDTIAVHARPPVYTGTSSIPITTPICHSSTYRIKKIDDFLNILTDGGQIYSRCGNFTTDAVECSINALEQGAGSLTFSSGMAAISTVFVCFLNSGDHVIVQNPAYSNSISLLKDFVNKFGIQVTQVPAGCDINEFRKNVKPNTKMLYGETPCNPDMSILDLEEFGKLGQSLGILTVVDSTFASPFLQQPIKYSIDISIHSCTKYMGGHSDLIAGCVTTRTLQHWRLLKNWNASMGCILSPHDASLLLRGLKTLPIRMEKHSLNGLKIAQYLENHPKVEEVFYPGLPSHPQHETAKKQMKLFGGMISFKVRGGEKAAITFAESVKLVHLTVSLGGVESLIEHPYSMTHGSYLMSREEQEEARIHPSSLRLSVGLEDVNDIIKDFEQAFTNI